MSNFYLSFLVILLFQPFISSGDKANSYQMNSWLTGDVDYGSPPSSDDGQKETVLHDAMIPNQAPVGYNLQYPQYPPPPQQVQQLAGSNYPPQAPSPQHQQVIQNSQHVQQAQQYGNAHHAAASQHQQHPQHQVQNVQGQGQTHVQNVQGQGQTHVQNVQGQGQTHVQNVQGQGQSHVLNVPGQYQLQMIQGQQYPSMNAPVPPAQPPNHAVNIHVQQRPPQAPADHPNMANFHPNAHLQSGPGQGQAYNQAAANQQAFNVKPKPEVPQEESWKVADEPNPWFFEEAKPPPAFSAEDERIRQEKFGSMKDKWQIEDDEAKKQANLKNNQGQVVYEQAYAHRGDFTGESKRIGSGAIVSVSKNNHYQPVGNPMPVVVPDPNFSKVPKNFYEGKIQQDPNSKLILEQTYGNWEHPRKNNPRPNPTPRQPSRQGQRHTMDDPPASIQFRKQWYDDSVQPNGESGGGISLTRKVKVPLTLVVCSALIVWNL